MTVSFGIKKHRKRNDQNTCKNSREIREFFYAKKMIRLKKMAIYPPDMAKIKLYDIIYTKV